MQDFKCLPSKLPSRVFRKHRERLKSRVRFGFVNDPQSEPADEVARKQRFMAKLIRLMGLQKHPGRIQLAREYIQLNKTKPDWSIDYDTNDPKIAIALNLPADMTFNKDVLCGETTEYACANEALVYIWLNEMWPQEQTYIECMCGRPDEDCNDSCEESRPKPKKKRLKISEGSYLGKLSF